MYTFYTFFSQYSVLVSHKTECVLYSLWSSASASWQSHKVWLYGVSLLTKSKYHYTSWSASMECSSQCHERLLRWQVLVKKSNDCHQPMFRCSTCITAVWCSAITTSFEKLLWVWRNFYVFLMMNLCTVQRGRCWWINCGRDDVL